MSANRKVGRPSIASLTQPPAPSETAKSVLQNLANAKEHEDVGAEPVQTQLEATQKQAEPTAPATMDACAGCAAKMDVDHELSLIHI